jgi:hypothetical protein
MNILLRASALAALLLLPACGGDDFDRFSEVQGLRLLGIEASPPGLGPDETLDLRAVLVGPGADEARITWELCLADEGPQDRFRCATIDGAPLGLPLGQGPAVQLDWYDLFDTPQELDLACAGKDAPGPDAFELDCGQGIPVTVRLTVEQGGDTRVARRSLRLLTAALAAAPDRNRNPSIRGLRVGDLALDDTGTATWSLADGRSPPVRWEGSLDDAQRFVRPATGREVPVQEREVLSAHWFTTHGAWDVETTYFGEGRTTDSELFENELRLNEGRPPAPGEVVQVWVVVRDTRGGFAVRSGRFTVTP